MQTLNLCIECLDRPGLLAEIAQTIASYGHNIKVCLLPSHLPYHLYSEHGCRCNSLPPWPPYQCVDMGHVSCSSSRDKRTCAPLTYTRNHPGCMCLLSHVALDGNLVLSAEAQGI